MKERVLRFAIRSVEGLYSVFRIKALKRLSGRLKEELLKAELRKR